MRITVENIDEQIVIDRVYKAGQQHVFKFWPELDKTSRSKLIEQLKQVDFELMAELNRKFIQSEEGGLMPGTFEPAEFTPLPETPEEISLFCQARGIGEKALRDGRVAAFLVAGGQGTRLGFDGPKGKFPVSPVKNKTLFQLHSEKILALSKKYDVIIPWYIMTSETNHQETVDFFVAHDYFGLNSKNVMFFRQEMIPALDPYGRLILDEKDHIFRNPNGHGGSLSALKKSGALDDMKSRGIDLIFYFQVDNVLVKICDPDFIGSHLQEQAEMSAKVVTKTDPGEKVGVLGRIDGKLGVIEYSDLAEAEKTARNPDGTLKFRAGSIAIHILNVDFVELENEGGLKLPWHMAHKKVAHVDEEGNRVEPDEPNGYKFETFVFDALGDAKETVFLEVKREEEFSPVKNAKGIASPETARRDMVNQFRRWLEQAGVQIPTDCNNAANGLIEISPLFALDGDDLKVKVNSDLKIEDKLYLE